MTLTNVSDRETDFQFPGNDNATMPNGASVHLIRHHSIEARAAGRETRSLRSLPGVDTFAFDLEPVRKELGALPVLVIGIVTADPPACASTPLASETHLRPLRINGWLELDGAVGAS